MFRHSIFLILPAYMTFAGCAHLPPHVPVAAAVPEHRTQYELGRTAMHEFTPEGYARAIQHLERAYALDPANCEYGIELSHASLFLALEQKLNAEEFLPALTRAAETAQCADPGTPEAMRLEAFRSLDIFRPGQERAALAQINQAIELDPSNALNWFVRWKLNPTTNRQENSILKAAELSPELPLIQYEVGNLWLLRGDYESARQAFELALKASHRHFRSLIGMAQAISALGHDEDVEDEVIDLYKRAVELGPDFLEGRILLGDYYSGLEEKEAAREQYAAVVARNPQFEVAHLRMGLSYLQAGEWDDAERSFAAAIEINPSSYEAFYYTGNIWFARGNLDEARTQYEQALQFVLNFPEAVYALGTVHYRQGRIDQALEHYERVIQINRAHADSYFGRAGIRAGRRQFREAIEDYDQALRLYDRQWGSVIESIGDLEQRGLVRKADAERIRKERLEQTIGRAREAKMKAEDSLVAFPAY